MEGIWRAARVFAAMALMGALTAMAPPATGAGPGSIGGTVTSSGNPVAGVNVTAYDASSGDWAGAATTDEFGTYRVSDLADGTYRIGFWGSPYVAEFWDDVSDFWRADDIVVQGGATVGGKDADLVVGGSLAGTVTDAHGPLEGVHVSAKRHVVEPDSEWWQQEGETYTGPDGSYTVAGLPTGEYVLKFSAGSSGLASEWWDDQPTLGTATTFDVVAGQHLTGFDAVLSEGGSIAGTVTGATGPVPWVTVSVSTTVPGTSDWVAVDSGMTAADGTYTVPGLSAGTYFVEFEPAEDSGYLPEFWNDTTDRTAADPVVVEAGGTATADAVLAGSAALRGRVVTPTGSPVDGVQVAALVRAGSAAEGWWWDQVRSTQTGPDGRYRLDGLRPRSYKVEFSHARFITEYYDDKPTIRSADAVTVTQGQTLSGIGATLARAATIRGTVTDRGGQPLSGIDVSVLQRSDGWWDAVRWATTGDDGSYTVGGLASGTYRIQFRGTGFASEFYPAAVDLDTADNVVLTAPETFDALPVRLDVAGVVTGQVVDGFGAPLEETYVYPYRRQVVDSVVDWVPSDAVGVTDGTGSYRVEGLRPGKYKVMFWKDDAFESLFFPGTEYMDDAEVVLVEAGSELTGVDTTLRRFVRNSEEVPQLTGRPVVGNTLTVVLGEWTPGDPELSYEWYAGDEQIDTDGPTYQLAAGDVGSRISVVVRASAAGHAPYEGWAGTNPVRKRTVVATLAGQNVPGSDRLTVTTGDAFAGGAVVVLYRSTLAGLVQVDSGALDGTGAATFDVPDPKPRASTTYLAKVRAGPSTLAAQSNKVSLS